MNKTVVAPAPDAGALYDPYAAEPTLRSRRHPGGMRPRAPLGRRAGVVCLYHLRRLGPLRRLSAEAGRKTILEDSMNSIAIIGGGITGLVRR